MMKHVYVEVSKYINEVKQVEGIDSVVKDLLRPNPKDTFRRVTNKIRIKDDWLTFAEKKMVFVEAAVFENRQFIREDGEVLPIERVKKISSLSTRHLAKHSDYIEKITEENDVIPSKLYTVNKDTDYGVYENKFLYLLLETINDFISREREDVDHALKSCNGELSLMRNADLGNDTIKFEIKMSYRSQDPTATLFDTEKEKIERMDSLKARVLSLLQTPLMQVVSKEPAISSVITKTNVLTMNENFSNSLELYEYLVNYDKSGFEIEKTYEDVAIGKNIALTMLACEFMTQAYKDDRVEEYERAKAEIISDKRKKEIEAIEERISHLREEYEKDPVGYISILMDKISLLEEQNGEIPVLKDFVNKLQRENTDREAQEKALKEEIERLEKKLEELMKSVKENDKTIQGIKDGYENKLKSKDAEIQKLKEASAAQSNQIAKLESEKEDQVTLQKEYKARLDAQMKKNEALIAEYEAKIQSLQETTDKALKDFQILEARIKGEDALNGRILPIDAETSKEAFDALEEEYNAFTVYFEEVWKRTKKEIIKEIKRKKG